MIADLDPNASQWGQLAVPLIGVLATLLAFLVGWLLVRGRERDRERGQQRVHQRVHKHVQPVSAESDEPRSGKVDLATDPFVQGSVVDRRSATRRRGNAIAILISDAEGQAAPDRGWVVDRSVGGLCLSVPQRVEPDTILSVRTTNAPQTCPWVQLHVRSCRQVGKEWELGCQFVRTPPWSVLLLFG